MKKINEFIKEIGSINRYMLLSRLQSDCEYFLWNGDRSERSLWTGNVESHIWCMKVLYYVLPINEKPSWITMENILDYEIHMKRYGE